ncbi:HD-GYP domain-containing protein [Clostridium botulinum]|uniref:HD-GYP domain-containing protein n=1 Tax=Clostridium botulinum TaxID=1491 RepID=UPI00067D67FC|nr:HD domain-containing phosphohydrolase [Clostridium botulinum]MBY6773682.1 HD domain-containing protein [Clostridium botulinum]MBY6864276.1 HD domain-containing protein [Clostridium botulinum]MBY6984845.1 HD domain-containing protein [Clostridium botulinum]
MELILTDEELKSHLINVSNYCTIIGNQLNMDKNKLRNLSIAGKFHDIGKVKIDPTILYKKERLTEEEKEIIENHTLLGAEILNDFGYDDEIIHAIRFHHEFWNGSGYEGLRGEEIPLMARIISIADTFDAITNERVYKKAKTINYALGELKYNEEIQFDRNITEVFIDYIKTINSRKSYYFFKNKCNIIHT